MLNGVLVGCSFHLDLVLWFSEVGVDEEVAEENEVAAVHAEGEVDVGCTHITTLTLYHHFQGVYVDKDTGDHLKNLGSCDANWDKLGGFVAGCPDSVVTVHDSVNHVVDRAEPSTSCNGVSVAVPAVDKNSDVMIPVEEYQSLFSQHHKDCVSQFWQLAEHEKKRPERRVILGGLFVEIAQ